MVHTVQISHPANPTQSTTSRPNGFGTPPTKQVRQKERCGKSTQDEPSPAKIMKPSRPCPHPCKKLPAVVSVIACQENKASTEQAVESPPPAPEVEIGKGYSMYDEDGGKHRFLHSFYSLSVWARQRMTSHFGISARQKDGGSTTSGHL